MGTRGRRIAIGASAAAAALLGASPAARGAGIEHPDIGTISIGRGGAYAAAPIDGLALQYNPAGFAAQRGLRLTLDGNLAWQSLTFTPAGGGAAVSNGEGAFLVPAGAVSYGLGPYGVFSELTFALGATGPSALGRVSYPPGGAQRYAIINTDYFIAYYSAAVAASIGRWISLGATFQMVRGTARFTQAVWSGSAPGTDPANDSIATVDVTSTPMPTAVLGVNGRPMPHMIAGLSYRPHFTFRASGTLTTQLPAFAAAAGVRQVGDSTDFVVPFPDVIRFGVQYSFTDRLLVEGDIVGELWSRLKTIEIQPRGIEVTSDFLGVTKPLPNIVFQKDYQDAVSIRVGADFAALPRRLTVRAGYLHETSAIPLRSVSVDFGNWQRDAVSVGASVTAWGGVSLDLAYAHHFMPNQNVTSSQVVQVVTPCVTPGCTDPAPTVVGNGVYTGSLDVFSLSLRLVIDDLHRRP
jgi:long-subunit fatty acid transport protein